MQHCTVKFFFSRTEPKKVNKEYKVEVSITQGGLVASIRVVPLGDEVSSISISDLHEALQDAGVIHGIRTEILHQIAEEKSVNKWVTIARGDQPGEGKDGYVLYRFSKDGLRAKLKEDGSGRVNIKDMNLIQNVAKGDILMILDADITVPPEDLPRFYDLIANGSAEFVNGVRLVYPMEDDAMHLVNLIGNKFFSWAFSWLLGQPI
ncbi:MAG TPA: FapA family protein, partial [Deltaproteobacteria bacterium]|nr:FapA family protein [Deltaproteobacteria bacterium]